MHSEPWTLLSCGVGEDVSFDVEFSRLHSSKVIFVDPTPRSVDYLDQFYLALQKKLSFLDFPDHRLDLSGLDSENFSSIEKAVWDRTGKMEFYPPKVSAHVSYSLANIQKTDEGKAIEVAVDTVYNICRETNVIPNIVKFDIEGVAATTIIKMFKDGIFPKVILTELEELMSPSGKNKELLLRLEREMSGHGYSLLARDGIYNFTFIKL